MSDCFHIFTHKDLDGILSLLVFKWFYPENHITYKAVNNINVDSQISDYLQNSINPHNIKIFDLPLRETFLNFDLPFITFIDHHKRSEDFKDLFKNSKIVYKEYSSNVLFLYKFLQKTNPTNLTDNQKKLILIGDDYDSGNHAFKESYDLNILFWALYRNDINKFLFDFNNGYKNFTDKESSIIYNIKKDALKTSLEFPVYKGEITFNGIKKQVISSFGETTNLISMDFLMKKNNADVLFFINTKTEKISLKQKRSDNMLDIGELAKKYCDGNGHLLSAGGKLTDLFLELTKNFHPV